ncbi:MAG: sulfatase-like hydrolase/transferase [Rikenellaceae bacterium]
MNNRSKMLLTAAAISTGAAAQAAQQPNLLIIHTDEHNFRTLSCYQRQLAEDQAFVWGKGVNVDTPHLDRIADEGAINNRHYCSTAVSTPSRASLITGLYPQATGAYKNGQYIREDIPTFATILRDNGYATSYVGKWHLAGDEVQYQFGIKYKAGFEDNTYMMTGGHSPYFQLDESGKMIQNPDGSYKVTSGGKNLDLSRVTHLTEYFTDRTVDIINRDYKKPFCVVVSIPDPHTPDIAMPPYSTMYDDMKPTMPRTMQPKYLENLPAWSQGNKKGAMTKFDPNKLKQYFGMVKQIDDCVGRMLKALEDKGVLDNTIVIFTSDHGDMFYEHSRMNKGVPYDASVKIPFIIRYPKRIKAGTVVNSASVNCDIAPTVLSLMGVPYKADIFHGIDISSDLTSRGKGAATTSRYAMAENNYGSWALLSDSRYKLIISSKETPWLIDLEKNPDETVNYIAEPQHKEMVKAMQTELVERLQKYKSPHLKSYQLMSF